VCAISTKVDPVVKTSSTITTIDHGGGVAIHSKAPDKFFFLASLFNPT